MTEMEKLQIQYCILIVLSHFQVLLFFVEILKAAYLWQGCPFQSVISSFIQQNISLIIFSDENMEVLLINPQCRRGDDIKDNIVVVLYDNTRLRQRLWRVVAKYVDLETILQWSGHFFTTYFHFEYLCIWTTFQFPHNKIGA